MMCIDTGAKFLKKFFGACAHRGMLAIVMLCVLSACGNNVTEGVCDLNDNPQDNSIYVELYLEDAADPSIHRGPIETVVRKVGFQLKDSARAMYNGILESNFSEVLQSIILLYLVMYGVTVAIGTTKVRLGDALVRAFKVCILAMILGDGGFDIFYNVVGRFFIEGSDQFINAITQEMTVFSNYISTPQFGEAMGSYATEQDASQMGDDSGRPFATLDVILARMLSSHAIHFYTACLFEFPVGWIYLLVMVLGIYFVSGAAAFAVWIYLMSLAVRMLLIGLAPLFVVCMLFKSTNQYFENWVRQLISFSLQPIILFTFLAMFATLIDVTLSEAYGAGGSNIRVCFMKGWLGPFPLDTYRFAQVTAGGSTDPVATANLTNPTFFPLPLQDVLVYFAFVYMAWTFQPKAVELGTQITGTFIPLTGMKASNPFGDLPGMMKGGGKKAVVGAGKAAAGLASMVGKRL